jgi:hypothetical protein
MSLDLVRPCGCVCGAAQAAETTAHAAAAAKKIDNLRRAPVHMA